MHILVPWSDIRFNWLAAGIEALGGIVCRWYLYSSVLNFLWLAVDPVLKYGHWLVSIGLFCVYSRSASLKWLFALFWELDFIRKCKQWSVFVSAFVHVPFLMVSTLFFRFCLSITLIPINHILPWIPFSPLNYSLKGQLYTQTLLVICIPVSEDRTGSVVFKMCRIQFFCCCYQVCIKDSVLYY